MLVGWKKPSGSQLGMSAVCILRQCFIVYPKNPQRQCLLDGSLGFEHLTVEGRLRCEKLSHLAKSFFCIFKKNTTSSD